MATEGPLVSPFNNGYWVWDDLRNCLYFVSRDIGLRAASTSKDATIKTVFTRTDKTKTEYEIKFRDITDKLEKLVFKRYFQRRVRLGDPDVVTIQDVKDIALYLANIGDLTVEFIHFIHTIAVDKFLRALVVYFQYFIDMWDWMMDRRVKDSRKLRQPIVTELENIKRDDLADIRAMLAREYLSILGGLGDSEKHHHMAGKGQCSLSGKDKRLHEMLLQMAVRIVWIACQRRHLHLIELELNRMFRSDSFNIVSHRRATLSLKQTPAENRVLIGTANRFERILLQRSPLVKELLFADHEHRMLGVGVKTFQPKDARIDYIEAAYSLPEEQIIERGIAVGLLGIPREEFDPVLISRERTSKTYTKQITEVPEFKLPPKEYHSYTELPNTFPKEPCPYRETAQSIRSRKIQCKMWVKHVKSIQLGITESTSDKGRQESLSIISTTEVKS